MLEKIRALLKSCFSFWFKLIFKPNRGEFLKSNQGAFKTQIIILLASALIVFVFYSTMKPVVRGTCRIILQSDDSASDYGSDRIVGIEAKRAILGTTLREVKSIGTLKANAEVIIKSEIPGKVVEVLFKEGSNVKKGDTLIKFEDDLYRAEKEKYEAEYTLNKTEFERVDRLYREKVGAKKSYDEAYARMQASKAQLDTANYQLSRTVIKAPFDGTIGIMRGAVTPGNVIQQQTELVYLVDNSTVRVEFPVPAKYIDDIAVGQNVEVSVDAFKDRVFHGVVDAIDSEIDARNHSILVRAIVPNKSGNLKHGLISNVKLVTGEKSDVILIDEDSLDREGSIEFVWAVDEKGRAYRKRVLTGAKGTNGVEILAGLQAGEIVVTTGQLKLTEGSKTKILNKEEFEESSKSFDSPKNEESKDESSGDEEENFENLPEETKKIQDQVSQDASSTSSEGKQKSSKNSESKVKKFFTNILKKKL